MERVREALKREEMYLLQVQKAAEHQLGVLKAEQVVLERQIRHHEQTNVTTALDSQQKQQQSLNVNEEKEGHLPELQLELDVKTGSRVDESMEEEEEERED